MNARVKELQATRRRWVERLESTSSHEERKEILRTIEGLDNSIQYLQEELWTQGCYLVPAPGGTLLTVIGLEVTQSTQYFHEGTGAGDINTVWLMTGKPVLVRVYLRLSAYDPGTVAGRLAVMAFNNNTLEYDILRRSLDPMRPVAMAGASESHRRDLDETLNFLVPAEDCWGRVRFDATAWVSGHESEPIFRDDGVQSAWFQNRRVPVIHLFRIDLSQTVPSMPAPTVIAAPSLADCEATMAQAERMLPVNSLDIRDRGTRAYSGPLQTRADYDAVRADIQGVRNGTTPTPEDHEIYVAMLPPHTSPGVWGQALGGSLQSTVNMPQLFSHELGHVLLPGDDHVSDTGCALNTLISQVDANYPDYPNAIQRSGIGEFAVDLGQSPPRLLPPDTPEIMSYCNGPQWISPYNYLRAFNGDVLNWTRAEGAPRAGAQKLVLSFRLHRGGEVDFLWAMHLPGEPRRFPPKVATGMLLEMRDADDALLASQEISHRSSELLATDPYQDLQEVLPWFDQTSYVALIRDGRETVRWAVEDPPVTELVSELSVSRTESGERGEVVVDWSGVESATSVHTMLRFTPDDGMTWIPITGGLEEPPVRVASSHLRGLERCRFQLAVSTGFRTTLVESSEEIAGPPLSREITIAEPRAGAMIVQRNPVWLVGAVTSRLDGRGDPVRAFWSSNRDGFLGDGLRVLVSGLSPGRHVLRLAVADESGDEATRSVTVWVQEQG